MVKPSEYETGVASGEDVLKIVVRTLVRVFAERVPGSAALRQLPRFFTQTEYLKDLQQN